MINLCDAIGQDLYNFFKLRYRIKNIKDINKLKESENYHNFLFIESRLKNAVLTGEEIIEVCEELLKEYSKRDF